MADKSTITPDRVRQIVKNASGRLHVNTVGDEVWACDSYWAAPITPQVSALLTKAGHDLEPRSYTVETKVTAAEHEPPKIAQVVPEEIDSVETADGWELAEFAHIPGMTGRLYTEHGQVIMTAGGHLFAVNVDFLSIVTGRVAPFVTYDADTRRTVGLEVWAQVSPAKDSYGFGKTPAGVHKPLIVLSTHELRSTHLGKPATADRVVDRRAVVMPVRV